jgi:hypothetical protein
MMLPLVCAFVWACEDEPKPETKVEAATPAVPEKPPEPTAEEKEAKEKAAEAKKAQAEVEANPLTECCRALGSMGFTKRSTEYMAASTDCGSAMTNNKSLADATAAIKKALKGQELPEECEPKKK